MCIKGHLFRHWRWRRKKQYFFSEKWFQCRGDQYCPKNLKKCEESARKENLPITTKLIDIRKFKSKKGKYSLIVAINSLDFLKLEEIEKIIKRVHSSLLAGGIFYLYGFSAKDPLSRIAKRKHLKELEKNTFYFPRMKIFRHFFEKKELLNLCKVFEIIELEKKKIIHAHMGSKKPHHHWIIRVIAKKQRSVNQHSFFWKTYLALIATYKTFRDHPCQII